MAAVPPGQICSRPLSPRHPGRVEEATRRAPAGRRGWRRGRGREGARAAEPSLTRVQTERRELLKETDSSGSPQSHGGIYSNNKMCSTHVAIMLCPYPLPLFYPQDRLLQDSLAVLGFPLRSRCETASMICYSFHSCLLLLDFFCKVTLNLRQEE